MGRERCHWENDVDRSAHTPKRVTPVAVDTGPGRESSSSAAAGTAKQRPATDTLRAVLCDRCGCVKRAMGMLEVGDVQSVKHEG